MDYVSMIGSLALGLALLRLAIAFPAQIRKNKKLQNCEGLASTMVYSTFVSYVLWTLYGWVKIPIDWPIAISSSIGTILSGIIVYQFIYYGRKRKGDKK